MSKLFHRIRSFWSKRAPSFQSTTPYGPAMWADMIDPNEHLDWSGDEAGILLRAERNKPFCHAKFVNTEEQFQTVLLGFDLKADQILIDEFFPVPKSSLLNTRFELTITAPEGLLVLEVTTKEKVYMDSQPSFVLSVLSKKRVNDRRLNPRIQFTRNIAPKIELIIPMSGLIKGHLIDLSTEGLTMNFFGAQKPQLMSSSGECTLHFSDQVKLRVKMRIKQVSFSRKPCSHTMLRMLFRQTSDTQNDQLHAFIQSFEALTKAA